MEIATPTPIPNVHGDHAVISPSGRTWKQHEDGQWSVLFGGEWKRLPEPNAYDPGSWNRWARFCADLGLTPGGARTYRPTKHA